MVGDVGNETSRSTESPSSMNNRKYYVVQCNGVLFYEEEYLSRRRKKILPTHG